MHPTPPAAGPPDTPPESRPEPGPEAAPDDTAARPDDATAANATHRVAGDGATADVPADDGAPAPEGPEAADDTAPACRAEDGKATGPTETGTTETGTTETGTTESGTGAPAPDAPAPAEPTDSGLPHGPDTATAAPPRRPRGRTALLLAAAVLLGCTAGLATGYTVQADRAPTPLAPLSQDRLAYPDEPLPEDEFEPIPAEHDRRVKTDGDLRELLIDRPDGAGDTEIDNSPDGWVSLPAYTREFESPASMLSQLRSDEVRRVAGTEWRTGRYRDVVIRLVQFRDTTRRSAVEFAREQQAYMPGETWANTPGRPLKGSDNGLYWVDEAPDREPGYLPTYVNRAIAARGDITMDIFVYDTEPVSARDIRELAERQWERL